MKKTTIAALVFCILALGADAQGTYLNTDNSAVNSWVLHTPVTNTNTLPVNVNALFLVPGTNNTNWNWGAGTHFRKNGDVLFNGKIGTNGLDPNSGYPVGSIGGVHTQDVYAEHAIGVGSGGALGILLNNNGSATFNGAVTMNSEVYGGSWFRNNAAGTGLFNQATQAGIYSPSAGMMSTFNGSSFTVEGEMFANKWFRNNAAGTGLFNQATQAGIYSPSAGMMSTFNGSSFTSQGDMYTNGNQILSGTNSWILHTPDDGRTDLYLAPNVNGEWKWSAGGTLFKNNGDVQFSGTISTNGLNPNEGFPPGQQGGIHTWNIKVENGMMIGTGNMAISAGYRLYVQTGILTEKVKVAVNGSANWSDYVFDKNYKLPGLDEVENFVKVNKHLPNIPSAEEMVKEGNDLGNTDAKLLAKIEELTLYIIEMNKKIAALEMKATEKSINNAK